MFPFSGKVVVLTQTGHLGPDHAVYRGHWAAGPWVGTQRAGVADVQGGCRGGVEAR
jgi:hypothetical protein